MVLGRAGTPTLFAASPAASAGLRDLKTLAQDERHKVLAAPLAGATCHRALPLRRRLRPRDARATRGADRVVLARLSPARRASSALRLAPDTMRTRAATCLCALGWLASSQAALSETDRGLPVSQLLSRGDLLLANGQGAAALDYYDEAIERSPDDYLSRYKRATARSSLGASRKALEDLEAVLRITEFGQVRRRASTGVDVSGSDPVGAAASQAWRV